MTETDAIQAPPEKSARRMRVTLNGLLAAMVSIYSILTAVVVFSGYEAEGLYYDNIFIAQAHLNDASELAIEAHLTALHDIDVWEQIEVHMILDSNPEVIDFLYGELSGEAQASVDRSGGLDETYGEEVFNNHMIERGMAMDAYDHAVAWSERASVYQILSMAMAVGLAFAAWASLMKENNLIRGFFIVVATLLLIGSLLSLGFQLVTREPLDEYGEGRSGWVG